MKKFILFISIILISGSVRASHVFGADLTYTCQGNGNYLITYTYFRDCFGIPAPPTQTLTLTNSCINNSTTYTLQQIPPALLISKCQNVTTCNGGSLIGIEKYVYQTVITLNDTCAHWILGVKINSRSAWITIFENPENYSLYVEATINNTNGLCDTSTIFENDPLINTCVGQPNCIDPGLFDTESDSIVASFINPQGDANVVIPYDTNYSISYPMNLSTPITIDNSTGRFCFTPLSTIVTVYAIKISSFRNGELVGEVERDMMLYALTCPPSQPDINLANSFTTDTFVCVNSVICLDMVSTDPTPNDSTWLSWDSNIPAANFSITSGQNETAGFCWTPSLTDINTLPHCFTTYVHDNNCPVYQSNAKTYCIMVYDSATCLTLGNIEFSFTNTRLNIFPQPVKDLINVSVKSGYEGMTFCINDITGKILFKKPINPNENNFSITTEFLNPGIYIATLRTEAGAVLTSTKMIKLKTQ